MKKIYIIKESNIDSYEPDLVVGDFAYKRKKDAEQYIRQLKKKDREEGLRWDPYYIEKLEVR